MPVKSANHMNAFFMW